MKILFELEDRIRHDSTCVYFRDAFAKLADVTVLYPEQIPMVRPGYFDLHVRVDYGINYPDYGKVDPWCKDLHPSVYYCIDTHIDTPWRLTMAKEKEFDHVFCAQMPALKSDWHTKNVHWLPLGCDPNVHVGRRMEKKYDVCFIGNTQPSWQSRRIDRLDKLFKNVDNFWVGNKYFQEATKIYNQSRVVFNSAHSTDINMRVFEAMASGSCLLTDAQDWQGLFESGKHFMEYTDENMLEKVEWILKNDVERERMAVAGQALVLEKHTYLDRAKSILRECGL